MPAAAQPLPGTQEGQAIDVDAAPASDSAAQQGVERHGSGTLARQGSSTGDGGPQALLAQ
jgi:hypothetical protein